MTPTPDVPHRLQFTVEVPGSPDQVWAAIATAGGISAWFLPTDVDEREGGALVTHMGETDSPATITSWDPPRRLVYEEPDWATLVGHETGEVTPLVSEFLVEARSGGTCAVTVVSSAFGTGADWEAEMFEEMGRHWIPFFDNLRLYLDAFPGQQAANLVAEGALPGDPAAAFAALRDAVGVGEIGDAVAFRGLTGQVERLYDQRALVRLGAAVPGYLNLWATRDGDSSYGGANLWVFGDEGEAYVEHEADDWRNWVATLSVPVTP